jgi:hypothetical protein
MSSAWETLRGHVAARGLGTLGAVMKGFAQPGAFDPLVSMDPRLVAPPNLDRLDLIGQLVRRGLDPAILRALMPLLERHPLERALIAWDALCGAIFVEGDPFVDELRAFVRPLKAVLPAAGVRGIDLNRTPSVALIKRYSGMNELGRAHIVELLGAAYEHKLAAYGELERRGDSFGRDHDVHVSLHSLARVLHLAHLPTLASVYLDYLSRALGYRAAGFDLCETLLDAEVPQHIPIDAILPGDLPDELLQDAVEYVVFRKHIAMGHIAQAHEIFEANLERRAANRPPLPARLVVVRAHLATMSDRPPLVSLDQVSRVCQADEVWRYAARVRVAVAAAQTGGRARQPLELLHDFVAGFGNDRRCWHEALVSAPVDAVWKRDSARLLGREAQHLPHERAVWEVLSMFMTDPSTIQRIVDEIDARLAAQARLETN